MLLSRAFARRLIAPRRIAASLTPDDQHLGLDGEVPKVEHIHFAELGHMLAVGPDAAKNRILGVGFAEAVVATGDHEARCKTLEVPLPWGRQGLIKVVDGEDDLPLRGGEAPEVDQMGVSAALHADAGNRVPARSTAMASAEPR